MLLKYNFQYNYQRVTNCSQISCIFPEISLESLARFLKSEIKKIGMVAN